MKKREVLIAIILLVIALGIGGGLILVSPTAKDALTGNTMKQTVIVKSNNFSLKLGENGDTHVVRISCKITYPSKYKRLMNKCTKDYGENMNAIIGNYFRQVAFTDLSKADFFDMTEDKLKTELNTFVNERNPSKKGEAIEYISEVILFEVLYQ